MKKLILWLIRVFKVDIPTEKIITETKIIEKGVYLPQNGVIDGDITIKGNVTVKGNLMVEGGLACYSNNLDK